MFTKLDKRGQSTLEYAVIIAVVVGALLAVQVYVKRGVQGRFKQAADDIGEQFSAETGTYNYTTRGYTSSNESSAMKTLADNTQVSMTTTTVSQTQNVVGTENTESLRANNEYWGKK